MIIYTIKTGWRWYVNTKDVQKIQYSNKNDIIWTIESTTSASASANNLCISTPSYNNMIDIEIALHDMNTALGLIQLENKGTCSRIQIKDCKISALLAMIPRLRSTLRESFISKANNANISS